MQQSAASTKLSRLRKFRFIISLSNNILTVVWWHIQPKKHDNKKSRMVMDKIWTRWVSNSGEVGNFLPAMGAAHVGKSSLNMLTSQMWQKKKKRKKNCLRNFTSCYILYMGLGDFLFRFNTSSKKLFVSYGCCFFCLFIWFWWYFKKVLGTVNTWFSNFQKKHQKDKY